MPCCSLKRRYERYILKVYPAAPGEAIDTAALGQLTFYALSQRNMLPKIAKFTAKKIGHDMSRSRLDRVRCGVQIFQALLDSCHSELKLFSEPYLRTVCGLLESNNIEYQQLAVASFQRFALIEEETTAYQRHYDTLVSMFSSMCWKNSNPIVRRAGLEGIKAIFQKALVKGTASLWEEAHLSLILPALLNNIKTPDFGDSSEPGDDVERQLPRIALSSLRDLSGRASFGNVKLLLRPVFHYLDKLKTWCEDDDYAGLTFRFIMTSIQPQYTHVAVSALLLHMDSSLRLTARDKTGITKVLSSSLSLAADRAIGPSIIEIFNTLLRHLRLSAESEQGSESSDEARFQSAIVDNCGQFANHLSDTQKVEILTFIIGKIPTTLKPRSKSCLLRCLVCVAYTHTPHTLRAALPDALLTPLLNVLHDQDVEVRDLALDTLATLLKPPLSRSGQDGAPHVSKGDIQFVRDKSESILWFLFSACRKETPTHTLSPTHTRTLRRIGDVLVLLACEFGHDQMLETMRMVLALQTTEENVSCVYAAFTAVFLKRVAVTKGFVSLSNFVDEAVTPFPSVLQCTVALAPLHLFNIPSLDEADANVQPSQDSFSSILFESNTLASALLNHVDMGDVRARLSQLYRHSEQPLLLHQESRTVKHKSRQLLDLAASSTDDIRPTQVAQSADVMSFALMKQRLYGTGDTSASGSALAASRDLETVWSEFGKRAERAALFASLLPPLNPSAPLVVPAGPRLSDWRPPVLPEIYSF